MRIEPFKDREEAGRKLAERLKSYRLKNPLILAIPRGGAPIGKILAEALGAELDIVIVRKLRAPLQPELALGAISEDGRVYLDRTVLKEFNEEDIATYLEHEKQYQIAEIARREKLFRAVRPRAAIKARSVIVADDGIATGSTMIAALRLLQEEKPDELIVAVPVGTPKRIAEVARYCSEVVCLEPSPALQSVGQFYENFHQVKDEEVVKILEDSYRFRRGENLQREA